MMLLIVLVSFVILVYFVDNCFYRMMHHHELALPHRRLLPFLELMQKGCLGRMGSENG